MRIWTVLLEDDDGNISDTFCFDLASEATEFQRKINEESDTGLTAYRPLKNWVYKKAETAIEEFDKEFGG